MPQTVEDLGRLVKQKYPGAYDSLSDVDVGSKVKSKYPQYSQFADMPTSPKSGKMSDADLKSAFEKSGPGILAKDIASIPAGVTGALRHPMDFTEGAVNSIHDLPHDTAEAIRKGEWGKISARVLETLLPVIRTERGAAAAAEAAEVARSGAAAGLRGAKGAAEGFSKTMKETPTSQMGAKIGGAIGTTAGYKVGGPWVAPAGAGVGAAIGAKAPALAKAFGNAIKTASERISKGEEIATGPDPLWREKLMAEAKAKGTKPLEPPATQPKSVATPPTNPSTPKPSTPRSTQARDASFARLLHENGVTPDMISDPAAKPFLKQLAERIGAKMPDGASIKRISDQVKKLQTVPSPNGRMQSPQ